jgi:hypothetical protein
MNLFERLILIAAVAFAVGLVIHWAIDCLASAGAFTPEHEDTEDFEDAEEVSPERLPQISGLPRPEWLHADIREWKKFLESPTGQKLYQQLIYAESGVFMEAVNGKANQPHLSTDFLRGRAQGYRTLFRDLDTLATTAAHAANLDTEDPEQAPVT